MSSKSRNLAVIAAVACSLVPAAAAHAQRYGSDPLPAPAHTYKAQPQRPYTLKVAPHTTAIQRPPLRESQRTLIEEPRRRRHAKHKVIRRTKILRVQPAEIESRRIVADSPRVIEPRRVVYDRPRVIERRRVVCDRPQVIERSYIVEACPTRRGLFQPGGWFGPGYYCRCNGY